MNAHDVSSPLLLRTTRRDRVSRILLVRHGQASWGADDYDQLSPLGDEQSRVLGAALAARGITPTCSSPAR